MNLTFNVNDGKRDCKYPKLTKELLSACKIIDDKFILYKIFINPKPNCSLNNCHNNVINYIKTYKCGEQVVGYYILQDVIEENKFYFILHSVVKKESDFIDITPTCDNRKFNLFLPLKDKDIKNYKKCIEYYLNNVVVLQE